MYKKPIQFEELSKTLAASIQWAFWGGKKTIRSALTHSPNPLIQPSFTNEDSHIVDRFTSTIISDSDYENFITQERITRFAKGISKTHEQSFHNLL